MPAQRSIETAVLGLGERVATEAVVIGSAAVSAALPGFREPRDKDLAVSEGVFRHLREQEGWVEAPDSTVPRLIHEAGTFDVGIGWSGAADYAGLHTRSWQTESGVRIAGLPDVVAYKWRRDSRTDRADIDAIRTFLHDPQRAPFGPRIIPHEVAVMRDCLPEALQDLPDAERAILLAANGLHIINTLYGHSAIGQVNQIVGELERPEFAVPATYHNGFGLVDDARALQRHFALAGVPPKDRLLGLAIDPYTDAVYGNGRFRDNPGGHDELRSAELLKAHALQLGYTSAEAHRMSEVVLGTTFDEQTHAQRGADSADALTRAIVAVDLQPLARPGELESTVDLAIEDLYSERSDRRRILGQALNAHGERVFSTIDAVRLIDRYRDERPATDGPTVMEAFAGRLESNAAFIESHAYPDGWTLDSPALRRQHAVELRRITAALRTGDMTAQEAYAAAQVHTVKMTEQAKTS